MEQSPRLSLSYVMPSQAQKHVTVNETFRRLDALVHLSVQSRIAAAEPAAPDEGDVYILPAGASGAAWGAFSENDLAAFQDGAWARISPRQGMRAWISDESAFVIFNGAAWTLLQGGGGSSETAMRFGVNATADNTNRLTVKSNAVLFSHDDVTPGSGDMQIIVNKDTAGDTASHLFQTGYSGRAEFGLTGDDDFHIKVSPDNFSTSYEAIVIDKDTGNVGIGEASPANKLQINGGVIAGDGTSATVNAGFLIKRPSDANARTFAIVENDTELRVGGGAWDKINFWTAGGGPAGYVGSSGGLVMGAPTGGDKGTGTINAQSVYDDNALLSCYVFDQTLDGDVSVEKWDEKTPDRRGADAVIPRRHEPLRKFLARIGTAHDPLTLDGYARHWRERRHLTSLPNEADFDPVDGQLTTGEWIQRLVETVEIQAVLIEDLNQRTKGLCG